MKKIVYVSNEWFVDTDITVLAELSRYYTIHWLYYTNYGSPRFDIDELKQYATKYGIILYLYDCHSRRLSWNLFKLQWNFISKIRAIKPDLVLRVSFHYYWVLLSFLLRKYKVVYAFHDVISHSNTKEGFLDDSCRNIIVKTNLYFILYSTSQYAIFMDKWKGKMVANVGMSIKDYGDPLKKLPYFPEGIRLLFFGRIESYKGLDTLISAMEEIAAKGVRNIQLSVFGKGSFWTQCERLIKTNGLYNLNIRFIETSELADIFSTHHFLVLPYKDATQSGPIMIAANYGLPIIAPKLEGFLQIYPSECGVYYNNEELINALLTVSKMSEDEYILLRKNVQSVKDKFSPSQIALNYKRFFDRII